MKVNDAAVMRLRAIVEADPSALVRVLQQFQARNVVPMKVSVGRLGSDFLDIEVELSGLASEVFRNLVAKINQMTIVLTAVACD